MSDIRFFHSNTRSFGPSHNSIQKLIVDVIENPEYGDDGIDGTTMREARARIENALDQELEKTEEQQDLHLLSDLYMLDGLMDDYGHTIRRALNRQNPDYIGLPHNNEPFQANAFANFAAALAEEAGLPAYLDAFNSSELFSEPNHGGPEGETLSRAILNQIVPINYGVTFNTDRDTSIYNRENTAQTLGRLQDTNETLTYREMSAFGRSNIHGPNDYMMNYSLLESLGFDFSPYTNEPLYFFHDEQEVYGSSVRTVQELIENVIKNSEFGDDTLPGTSMADANQRIDKAIELAKVDVEEEGFRADQNLANLMLLRELHREYTHTINAALTDMPSERPSSYPEQSPYQTEAFSQFVATVADRGGFPSVLSVINNSELPSELKARLTESVELSYKDFVDNTSPPSLSSLEDTKTTVTKEELSAGYNHISENLTDVEDGVLKRELLSSLGFDFSSYLEDSNQ